MPSNVRWFEGLLYAAFSVQLLSFLLMATLTPSNVTVNVVGSFALSALVWFAARRRQNWIKLMLFVFFVAVTLGGLLNLRGYLAQPALGLVQSAITVLESAAFACVFFGDSKGWFDNKPQQDKTGMS